LGTTLLGVRIDKRAADDDAETLDTELIDDVKVRKK